MSAAEQLSGGFITPDPLSPPPSSVASSSITGSTLPRPRSHPLKSGSAKETAFMNFVDNGVQQIQRRWAMKFSGEECEDVHGNYAWDVLDDRTRRHGDGAQGSRTGRGYESFKEAARDIEKLLEVVWVSGTPGLQVPYFLSLALLVVTYIHSFPPAPRSMFRIISKLDSAFASLIQGKVVETGEPLPGFEFGKRGVSGTEKVRIKSLIERTRVVVVETMSTMGDFKDEDKDVDGDETTGENDNDYDDSMNYDAGTDFEMDIARVYDRTLVELGDSLVGPAIGISDK